MNTADIIARRLYEAGCRYAFGIPGGEVLELIDALNRAGIRFVLTKHENCAGFMAEGTHHRTGAPAILVATIGPGAANAVNVVANAEQDRVPLIVLTGCVDAGDALTYTHQVFDHQAMFRPLVKATFRVVAEAADVLADKALAIATDDRPGPVHLDLPISVAGASVDAAAPVRRVRPTLGAPLAGPDLDCAKVWLDTAERPLIIAGFDAVIHDAGDALRELAEGLNAPVLTTYKAKGLLAEDHPLALGGAGLSPRCDEIVMPLVHAADAIVLAGYDPIEMRTNWRSPWEAHEQRVIELTPLPNHHYVHQAGMTFVGDVACGLRALIPDGRTQASWPEGQPDEARLALSRAFGQGEGWGPAAIVETVREVMPRETVATVDSGAHRILLSQVWRSFEPRTLLQSNGLCTMGCALPLATGSSLSDPERPAVCFTGDAGLEMVLGELATVRDLKTPVIVIVFADASLALIELKQRNMQLGSVGVDFEPTDFPAVAQALGGQGVRVRSRGALAEALGAARQATTFSVIACEMDRRDYDGRI